MRGHIVKRGKNSYSIKVSVGKDATGKYKYQWTTVKGTKKEAEKRLGEILHQLDTGTFMKPAKTTVADYLSKWLADYAKVKLSPRGFERYRDIIRQHLIPAFGDICLTQLKAEHVQRHYTAKLNNGLSAGTVRYHHAVIHKALQTALKWGLVNRNVADGVDVPPIRRTQMQTWDDDGVTQFLESAKESPYYALFYTALFTGMRRSELLGLSWQDVDLLLSQLSITRSLHHLKDGSYVFTEPKSAKSRRTIALSPSAILLLKEHKEKQRLESAMLGVPLRDNGLVFSTLEGKPLRPNTITRAWVMLTDKAGVKPIRLHDARHTHASIMLKQGVHPKIVQERLGHSSIEMTLDIYSHVMPGLQEAAAKRFDDVFNHTREKEPAKSD
ncbi:tyrosine-type recombinase/integrase [Chloroflexota bacterium]